MEVAPGARIADRYVVERALAKGGMGSVFVALDERMRARVALKVTAASGASADGLAERFAREARIGHRLGSARAGFVRATDWGRIDAVQLYLVMDLVDGAKPLDLRSGSRDERLVRWRRAAELVGVAHKLGVVHRDLKPANFLQAPDGRILLTDFGLAKIVGEAESAAEETLTLTGMVFGTPPYMPPEQLEDSKQADERADVYALGCMLFEALTSRLPYPGPAPNAVMMAHVKVGAGTAKAPRARDLDLSVPAGIDNACTLALDLDVGRRARTVAALLAALDAKTPHVERRTEPVEPRTLGSAPTSPPSPPSLGNAPTRAPVSLSIPPRPPERHFPGAGKAATAADRLRKLNTKVTPAPVEIPSQSPDPRKATPAIERLRAMNSRPSSPLSPVKPTRQERCPISPGPEEPGKPLDEALSRKASVAADRLRAMKSRSYLSPSPAELDRAIALSPDNPFNYVKRGFAKRARGDDRGAIEDFDNALRLEPTASWAKDVAKWIMESQRRITAR